MRSMIYFDFASPEELIIHINQNYYGIKNSKILFLLKFLSVRMGALWQEGLTLSGRVSDASGLLNGVSLNSMVCFFSNYCSYYRNVFNLNRMSPLSS